MKLSLRRIFFACVVGLAIGCNGQPSASISNSDSTEMIMDSLTNPAQVSKDPSGLWISAVANENELQVTRKGSQLDILWDATMDADLHLDGKLDEKGAGVYAGRIHYQSGDGEPRIESATLRFDPYGQTLTLDLPALWEDTVTFRRAAGLAGGCADAGERVIEKTQIFKDLAAKVEPLGINQETEDALAKVQDYQLYESRDLEIVTLCRLRVDFDNRFVLVYDAVENGFLPIAGSESLFAGVTCR